MPSRTAFAAAPASLSAQSSFTPSQTAPCARPAAATSASPPLRTRAPTMVARPENEPDVAVSASVESLYDRFPYPPETILDEPPLGYNWRWHYPTAYAFCTGRTPANGSKVRILDAGCGTGESTSYLVHLNPYADVVAIDLSAEALNVAKERLQRAVPDQVGRAEYVHKSIFDVAELPGQFDLINCVGVIHHTPDPLRALRALADKLAPGGIMHIFVYAKNGRWEISLMQEALRLLQKGEQNFDEGVRLGRNMFKALPDGNRLKVREETRWAQENMKDATFADMYVQPCETDYDVRTLFEMIDASGLEFVGMSNPRNWDIKRIVGADEELLAKAEALDDRDRLRLAELLDPETATHFEFWLSRADLPKVDWVKEEAALCQSTAELGPCIAGWPALWVMDRDYFPIKLSDEQFDFVKSVEETAGGKKVGELADASKCSMDEVREVIDRQVLLVTPEVA